MKTAKPGLFWPLVLIAGALLLAAGVVAVGFLPWVECPVCGPTLMNGFGLDEDCRDCDNRRTVTLWKHRQLSRRPPTP